jgi:hypothetical protein
MCPRQSTRSGQLSILLAERNGAFELAPRIQNPNLAGTEAGAALSFGHLTNSLIYRRLAPGLLKKLKERREERGSKSNKLHSWLSEDVGFREVLMHLGTVVGIMKLHTDYDVFEKQLDLVAPIYPETPGLFDNPKDWDEPE